MKIFPSSVQLCSQGAERGGHGGVTVMVEERDRVEWQNVIVEL